MKLALHETTRQRYLNYALSVITTRALPDVRDGCKPVQRRILYAMGHNLGLYSDARYRKSAAVVGEVMAKYHPHGDSSIYDAMVRMAQPFSLRHPLVDGQGNFGSLDGDSAAAMRYCVTGDAYVHSQIGLLRIEDLVKWTGKKRPKVFDFDGVLCDVTNWFDCGEHPTLRIQSVEGFDLVCTPNHPILCMTQVDGVPTLSWKLAGQVKTGDYAAIYRDYSADNMNSGAKQAGCALLLGAWLSEGHMSNHRAGFSNVDTEYFEAVASAYEREVGGNFYRYRRSLKSGKFINELDVQNTNHLSAHPIWAISGQKSAQKAIPNFAMSWPMADLRVLLQSLFEGDGSVSVTSSTILLQYTSISRTLLHQMQCILLKFGVVSKVYTVRSNCYKLCITNRSEIEKFAVRVGFWGAKQKVLTAALSNNRREGLSYDKVPGVNAFAKNNAVSREASRKNFDRQRSWESNRQELLALLDPIVAVWYDTIMSHGYYYAKIESVVPQKTQRVYSIRVDSPSHSFITNGFISHNTESKLTKIANFVISEADKGTVRFRPSYDGQNDEPEVLPVQFPHLLVNGSEGIAVGMATRIPPHNLREVIDACTYLIDHPAASVEDLCRFVTGPDFPTGGLLVEDPEELHKLYSEGAGSVQVQARWKTESRGRKHNLIITEIPYAVNKSDLVAKIGEIVSERKLPQVVDVRDESTEQVRIVCELRESGDAEAAIAYLYKHTALQTAYHGNLTCLFPVDGGTNLTPMRADLGTILRAWLEFRFDVVQRRLQHELGVLRDRTHILKAFETVFENAQEVLQIVRNSNDKAHARSQLRNQFGFDEIQADRVLELQVHRLSRLPADEIRSELAEKLRASASIESTLSDPSMVWSLIKSELGSIRETHGEARRTTKIEAQKAKAAVYDKTAYVLAEDTFLLVTRDGWAKRVGSFASADKVRVRDGDALLWAVKGNTRQTATFFTDGGSAYSIRADQIGATSGYGEPVGKHFKMADGEKLVGVTLTEPTVGDDNAAPHGVAVFESGRMLRFPLQSHCTPSTKNGRRYAKVEDDRIVTTFGTTDDSWVNVVTTSGYGLSIQANTIPATKAPGRGVIGTKTMILAAEPSEIASQGLTLQTPSGETEIVCQQNFASHRAAKGKQIKLSGFTVVPQIGPRKE